MGFRPEVAFSVQRFGLLQRKAISNQHFRFDFSLSPFVRIFIVISKMTQLTQRLKHSQYKL